MKEEDLDWAVYHLLVEDAERDAGVLAKLLGCSAGEIERSVKRLECAMLLECTNGGVRILSLQEMMLRCQARYDRSCPFSIEGGVIRARGGSEEKDD
ncbi:MAG TPA: AsnC family protein [Methanolinea sp.]|nr:AsnC family protein [Methanolinea sp.]HQK54959.1 AsnC family protein [Methanolinea sp.]